ncbi:MAG: coenzyme F420-0:L-glutamate ligase [bacterium]|nr:coenzyme F420-0:L-glutamate ligase [bacterium]
MEECKIPIVIVKPIRTKVFKEGDDLFAFVACYFNKLTDKSVIVVTSKIVALAEGRTAVAGNDKIKEKLIKKESDFALHTKHIWMTLRDGMVMASAGIDESNARGKFILLPKNSFKTARLLRKKLQQKYGIKNLGVLITDSRTVPLRSGVTGVALGCAGFRSVKDYKGQRDIFGRKFKFSSVDIADSLAAAAVLVMGEGKEQQPLAIITKAPVEFSEKAYRRELEIAIQDDMYLPLFAKLFKLK